MGIRIVLLEDHVVLREAFASMLDEESDLKVVGQAGTARELSLLLATPLVADVMLADLSLPGPSGLSAIRETRRTRPGMRILALSMYTDSVRVAEAISAGADGYAVKLEDVKSIVTALRDVLAGRRYLSPLVDAATVERLLARDGVAADGHGPLAFLSRREREVFDLVVRGHTNHQIAKLLFISARTADTHRQHIFKKLGVHNTVDLVRLAVRHGLLIEDAVTTSRE
jgi:DNA-binding NarL/FixJ family response regulator